VFFLVEHEVAKARDDTIFFSRVPFGCLCFWPQTLFSFLILLIPSNIYMWNFECALREMMIWSPLSNLLVWTTSCQPNSKKNLEHVVLSITFRWTGNNWLLASLKWMFSPNLCPYSCKKIVGISCGDPTSSPSWWSDWKQRSLASF
jgi:hypothetical protein